jgi:uncharacterized protein
MRERCHMGSMSYWFQLRSRQRCLGTRHPAAGVAGALCHVGFRWLAACSAVGLVIGVLGPAAIAATPIKSVLEMRRENVVVQEWDLSCGAAALTTLLRYQHGLDITEKEVAKGLIRREEYISNPDLIQVQQGFSLLDLKRFTDQLGFEGIGFGQLTLDDLIEKAPIIVPVNLLGYNHFVIFRGRLGDRVLLADPAFGNRTLTVDHFQSAWIDYPEIGHVGFVVVQPQGLEVPNLLAAKSSDFYILR